MKKRALRRIGIVAGVIAGLAVPAVFMQGFAIHEKPEKPNIIFLLTDDHRWDALGAMGNKILKTPHLDGIAGKGILFRNAYVTTSICCVSRASLLTGQYEARHGIHDFSTSFEPEALRRTYPLLLKEAGYQIGFIGKFGVGNPADQPAAEFDFWSCSNKSQPDYELTDEDGTYLHHTDKVSRDIDAFLSKLQDNKPFCLSVSFKAPHVQDNDPRQFIPHPRYDAYYADATIPVPETAAPEYWERFPDFFRTDENIARERWKLRFATPEMYQQSVKNYYRLLTGVDDAVGALMKKLSALGLDGNTIIIFSGDNGFYLGEHGLAGKWYGHEESIRVPLIVYDPRSAPESRGKVVDAIALNIDVAPTILKFAGVKVPQVMQGVDLTALARGSKRRAAREDFFYEHHFMGSPKIPEVEGVVSREVKYMNFTEHGYEELYDLVADPLEKRNLAQDPSWHGRLAQLRKRYLELKQEVR